MRSARRHARLLKSFGADAKGQIAILFAFASFALMAAFASGVDLSRAYQARQKLSQTAALACQFASRPSIVGDTANYSTDVQNFVTDELSAQNFGFAQTTPAPFTYTANGAADVTLTANVPTVFVNVLTAFIPNYSVTQIPISATSHCYDTPPKLPPVNGPVVSERFGTIGAGCASAEKSGGGCGFMYAAPGSNKVSTPGGSAGQYGYTQSKPYNTANSVTGYTGDLGWAIMGYCVEVDTPGVYPAGGAPGGYNSVELDCDNGSNSAGNSSISTNLTLSAGYYELRYYYNSRVKFPDYDPTYICGSTASDVSWANDTNSTYLSNSSSTTLPDHPRTDQINVYLDSNASGVPPTHTTIDGTQTLAGSNLIDMCVYTGDFNWIERSVRIYVTTSGSYWLSLAADGTNDGVGGAIADIRICQGSCTTTLLDNFPTAWTTSTNLFEDKFDSPAYSYSTTGSSAYVNTSGNMTSSTGTSGSGSGWPSLASSGWGAAPFNQIDYVMKSPAQGTQAIELSGSSAAQELISRGFLLDPGYYQVTYDYISNGQFSTLPSGLTGVSCGATPSAAGVSSLTTGTTASATSRATGKSATIDQTSNLVGLFMSHALEASTPVVGGALSSATSYNNPDGTTSTTPKAAPNAISLSSYNSSQVNPLLDICGYATAWQNRTVNIQITKPGYYWLTAASLGTPTAKFGGAIDDVKLTALGSPYMTTPPSSYVTIPTPGVSPGSYTTNTGFEFVNDPLTPPAPTQ